MSTLEEMRDAQNERDKIEVAKLIAKRDGLIRRRAEAVKRMAWVESLIFVRLREAAIVVYGDTDVKVDRHSFLKLAGEAYDAVESNLSDLIFSYDASETREPIKTVQAEIEKLQPKPLPPVSTNGKLKIFINGASYHIAGNTLSYSDVVLLDFPHCPTTALQRNVFTVTYRKAYNPQQPKGSLTYGRTVRVKNGTRFDVSQTSRG